MSLGLSRAVLRRQALFNSRQFTGRRAASSTTEAAASKASDGLTRVKGAAGSAMGVAGSALSSAGRALGGIGGRTGRLIGAVQSLIPPTVYYSKVAAEMAKIVFHARAMNPPSLQTFQSYFTSALSSLRTPSASIAWLSALRNASSAQLLGFGVIAAEGLGFFTVGEMLGRFKIIGYRSSAPAHH